MTVFLHAPWAGPNGVDDVLGYPAEGVIDAVMRHLPGGPRPMGFDLAGSPFGDIRVRSTFYAKGYDDFRLAMFCDGWIYTKPLSSYEGVTPIRDWVNASNLARARLQSPNPDWREYTAAQFNAELARSADLRRHWGRLR